MNAGEAQPRHRCCLICQKTERLRADADQDRPGAAEVQGAGTAAEMLLAHSELQTGFESEQRTVVDAVSRVLLLRSSGRASCAVTAQMAKGPGRLQERQQRGPGEEGCGL